MSHRTTIVFSDAQWRDIQAMRGDLSASVYVRQSVLMRIWFERGAEFGKALEQAKRKAP